MKADSAMPSSKRQMTSCSHRFTTPQPMTVIPQKNIITHRLLGPYFLNTICIGIPATRYPRLKTQTAMLNRWPTRCNSFSIPWIFAFPMLALRMVLVQAFRTMRKAGIYRSIKFTRYRSQSTGRILRSSFRTRRRSAARSMGPSRVEVVGEAGPSWTMAPFVMEAESAIR
jgi:hypothetical protein